MGHKIVVLLLASTALAFGSVAQATTVNTTLDFDSASGVLTSYAEDGYILEDLAATSALTSFVGGALTITAPDPDMGFVRQNASMEVISASHRW